MAKLTLLQMTQNILSGLSADEVNSISDSPESLQVANIIQNKYYDIIARGSLPDDKNLFQLTNFNDATRPVIMTIPSGTASIEWIKYFDTNVLDGTSFSTSTHGVNTDITQINPLWATSSTTSLTMGLGSKTFTTLANASTVNFAQGQTIQAVNGNNLMYGTVTSWVGTTLVMNVTALQGSGTFASWAISSVLTQAPGYRYVTILPLAQFLDYVNQLTPMSGNVQSYQFNEGGFNFTLYYRNDIQPSFCTNVSNDFMLFDSYDNTQDTTLQGSKTLVWGQQVPTFSLTDTFIPEMDDNQFPLLVNEAKVLAFYELKQQPHAIAEQEVKRQWSQVQKNKSLTNKPSYFDQLPNFGRTPNTGGYGGRNDRYNYSVGAR